MLDFNAAPDSTCLELEKLQPFVCPSTLRRAHTRLISREPFIGSPLLAFQVKKEKKEKKLLGFRLPAATVELQCLQHSPQTHTHALARCYTRAHMPSTCAAKKLIAEGKNLTFVFLITSDTLLCVCAARGGSQSPTKAPFIRQPPFVRVRFPQTTRSLFHPS